MEHPDDALLFSAGVLRRTIAPSPVSLIVLFVHAMFVISVSSSRIWSKFVRIKKKVIALAWSYF